MSKLHYWLISLIVGFIIFNWFRRWYKRLRYHSVARQRAQTKRIARDKRRDELLNFLRRNYSKYLPDRSITDRISHSTVVELLDGLRKKDFTHTQMTLVLSLRALKIGQTLNCTTEEFFDQAIKHAEQLDENDDNQLKLLLQGIPISIKDQIDQKGADSSIGISMRNFRPALNDSLIVQLLKEQGAFPGFVRTATIQGMMLPESESATYGVAANPFDVTRTPGGSSGNLLSRNARLV